MTRTLIFVLAVALLLSACSPAAPQLDHAVSIITPRQHTPTAAATTIPFILDAQRILVEVEFETPETSRSALVWFNMGMPSPVLSRELYRELHVDHGRPLRIHMGGVVIDVASGAIIDGDGGVGVPSFQHLFGPRPVEAMLPAAILQKFTLTLDYKRRTLSLADPGTRVNTGIAVPCKVSAETGLIAVDVAIDGKPYSVVIDAGTGYTWIRGDVVAQWLAAHPDWRRADGAVGESNANMVDFAFEKEGVVARIPRMDLGALHLTSVGLLGTAPVFGHFIDGLVGDVFWDNWRKQAPAPVIGWLGGNVLQNYALTIDYPNSVTYWLKQSEPDAHDLDSVGLTLVRRTGRYYVGGIVRKAVDGGTDYLTVKGVETGDELLAVDGVDIRGTGRDALLSALHGKPGEHRALLLEHGGMKLTVDAPITGFD
jgi:hypothetical protein